MAERLEKAVFFVFSGVRIYPRTVLYEQAIKEGRIKPGDNLLEPSFYWSSHVSREKVSELVKNHAAKRMNWIIGVFLRR